MENNTVEGISARGGFDVQISAIDAFDKINTRLAEKETPGLHELMMEEYTKFAEAVAFVEVKDLMKFLNSHGYKPKREEAEKIADLIGSAVSNVANDTVGALLSEDEEAFKVLVKNSSVIGLQTSFAGIGEALNLENGKQNVGINDIVALASEITGIKNVQFENKDELLNLVTECCGEEYGFDDFKTMVVEFDPNPKVTNEQLVLARLATQIPHASWQANQLGRAISERKNDRIMKPEVGSFDDMVIRYSQQRSVRSGKVNDPKAKLACAVFTLAKDLVQYKQYKATKVN